MTSAVMQAGFAPGPAPQGRMPSGKEKDAAGSAFGDAMRSGAKDLGQTGRPPAGQKPDGPSERLRPALHALGQAWQVSAADAENVAESENPKDWRTDARTERKLLEDTREALPENSDDAQEGEDESSEAGPLPAIALLLETVLRSSDPAAWQAAENTGGALRVAEALAAASGAGALLKNMKDGNDGTEPADATGSENALTADANGTTEAAKAGNRIASVTADLPAQPGASASDPDQQNRGRHTDRTSADQPAMSAREVRRDTAQPEPSGASAKASVVGIQSMPAPAANATTAAFLEAISADAVWKPQGAEAASNPHSQARPQPGAVHSLKIQLHPAELGMVTADLRFAGEQLSVELKVESAEAYHRLSSDSETIVRAFRALGYEIDRVTIQQPHTTSQANRADNVDANSGAAARDPQSTFSGNAGDGGTGSGGRGSTAQGGSDGRHAEGSGTTAQDRSSRGLYI